MRWQLIRYVGDTTQWQVKFALLRPSASGGGDVLYTGADNVPITFDTIEAAVHHVRDNFRGRGYSVEWPVSYGSGA